MTKRRTVQQGESVPSIAYEEGLLADTLWNAPENAALREARSSMHILRPGDVLHIPDRVLKTVERPTGAACTFRLHGVPDLLCVQLRLADQPRAGEPYMVEVDGVVVAQGTTGEDGMVRAPIPPTARTGRIRLRNDRAGIELQLGHLDPVDTVLGAQQRLQNLGYFTAPLDGAEGDDFDDALAQFQCAAGLPITAELDAATRAALASTHDDANEVG
jgi:hypothetical protein